MTHPCMINVGPKILKSLTWDYWWPEIIMMHIDLGPRLGSQFISIGKRFTEEPNPPFSFYLVDPMILLFGSFSLNGKVRKTRSWGQYYGAQGVGLSSGKKINMH